MAVFKCKMCGGSLEITENQSVATCEYCGTQQTLPRLDTERKIALFTRANNLRIKSEFDKAAGIYESIIAEFRDEAEAFWGLVLCKYGIEYVDDGKGKRVPTCHRTLPYSVMEDDDFNQACENADLQAKNIYREEAKVIDKIQNKILDIALNEEPYDIFICYKESDDTTGVRTEDSLIAQDIYSQLLKDGYRVFFARVSLRQVAGTEYEPYIYAALSSAKIMLAIGTKHDYYDAVWVKNEWSRFLSMMADDSSKVLIPCYKNMDAYDIPREFKNLQALDMNEVTFFGSLMENVQRVLGNAGNKAQKETIVLNNDNLDIAPLLERGFLLLEDKLWDKADTLFETVLNKDPKNAQAYLGKLLVDLNVSKKEELSEFYTTFSDNNNYEKIIRFADSELKAFVKNSNEIIVRRIEENRKKDLYENALEIMATATTEQMFENAGYMFHEIMDYADSKEKSDECFEKAEEARIRLLKEQEEERQRIENAKKDKLYRVANAIFDESYFRNGKSTDIKAVAKSLAIFERLGNWRDSKEKATQCYQLVEDMKIRIQQEQIDRERAEEENRRILESKAKRKKIIITVTSFVIAFIVVFAIILDAVIISNSKYNDAVALMEDGKYQEAIVAFQNMNGYKDSDEKIAQLKEKLAINQTISAGYSHTVGLKADGTVVAVGYNRFGQCDVDSWMDIVAISAGRYHTVGLKSDGTVVAVGRNGDGQCNVDSWTDIVSISAGNDHTVGLKSDGTVVAVGYNDDGQCDVDSWTDIVSISTGEDHTVGLKSDGTVVAVGYDGSGQCDVDSWIDIVAVSAGDYHTVGLKSDGTVVAVGRNDDGRCNVSSWTDIVAISAGRYHTVGLKSDGTVVAVGWNEFGQCNVDSWTDIVSISAGEYYTVGLKAEGTVVAVGDNSSGQCDVDSWTDIKVPENK